MSGYRALGRGDPMPIAIIRCGAFLAGVASHLYCDTLLWRPGVGDE